MANIPDTEPASVTAGDTFTWTKSVPGYPASEGWALSYVLINATSKIQLSATAAGDDYLVAVAASTTAAYAAGDYAWQAMVSKSAERYTVGSGRITIAPNIAALGAFDGRSNARKALEALEEAYVAYISNGQAHVAEYEIAGRRMKFRNAAEIWQQIEKLKREVAQEEAAARLAAGLGGRRRVLVRYGA